MIGRLRDRMRAADVRSDDAGLTLVEIVIYMVLAVVVGTIVVSMLIGTFTGQDQVTAMTRATTDGQLAAKTIERSVRNATTFAVTDGGMTLKVKTTLDEPCRQFTIKRNATASAGGRDVYDLFVFQGARLPSGPWPTASTHAIVSGVVLEDADHNTIVPFAVAGDSLDYTLWFATDLKASTTDSPNVDFSSTITPRGFGGDISSCS